MHPQYKSELSLLGGRRLPGIVNLLILSCASSPQAMMKQWLTPAGGWEESCGGRGPSETGWMMLSSNYRRQSEVRMQNFKVLRVCPLMENNLARGDEVIAYSSILSYSRIFVLLKTTMKKRSLLSKIYPQKRL